MVVVEPPASIVFDFLQAQIDQPLTAGGRLAITGPSGLGKTSLLDTLAGLIPPAAGRVRQSWSQSLAMGGNGRGSNIARLYAAVRADQIISTPKATKMKPVSIRPRLACSGWRSSRTRCRAPRA